MPHAGGFELNTSLFIPSLQQYFPWKPIRIYPEDLCNNRMRTEKSHFSILGQEKSRYHDHAASESQE